MVIMILSFNFITCSDAACDLQYLAVPDTDSCMTCSKKIWLFIYKLRTVARTLTPTHLHEYDNYAYALTCPRKC